VNGSRAQIERSESSAKQSNGVRVFLVSADESGGNAGGDKRGGSGSHISGDCAGGETAGWPEPD